MDQPPKPKPSFSASSLLCRKFLSHFLAQPLSDMSKSARKEVADARRAIVSEEYENMIDQLRLDNLRNLFTPLTKASRDALIRALDACASDPYGDGDQSTVPDQRTLNWIQKNARNPHHASHLRTEAAKPLRAAWEGGLGVQQVLFKNEEDFHTFCFQGRVKDVADAIEKAHQRVQNGYPDAMLHLLESRISKLRLTPLHCCVMGAKFMGPIFGSIHPPYEMIADLLCRAGARVDSRDLVGSTPLGTAVGMEASQLCLKVVPVLLNYGANPNSQLRFGTPILIGSIAANNLELFRMLLEAGADMSISDFDGIPLFHIVRKSPSLCNVLMEVLRMKVLKDEICGACDSKGVTKYCSACRSVFYCGKKCQVKGWKTGHKSECGNISATQFVDVELGYMTHSNLSAIPLCGTYNPLTAVIPTRFMEPKDLNSSFVVKISFLLPEMNSRHEDHTHNELEAYLGCIKIEKRNSDFLLLRKFGKANAVQDTLKNWIEKHSQGSEAIYLLAKWVNSSSVRRGTKKTDENHDVLRIDLTRPLPPPKPIW